MPVSSQPTEGHLMSAEVRGSGRIPPQLIKRTLEGNLVFVSADTTFLWTKMMLFFVCCCRCTSALSWSVGKHKTSLSPRTTRPQTSPSMCLRTGPQVRFYTANLFYCVPSSRSDSVAIFANTFTLRICNDNHGCSTNKDLLRNISK